MTTTLFLSQDIDLALELGMGGDGAWLGDHLTTLNVLAVDTTEQDTGVVTSLTLVQGLLKGFDTGHD